MLEHSCGTLRLENHYIIRLSNVVQHITRWYNVCFSGECSRRSQQGHIRSVQRARLGTARSLWRCSGESLHVYCLHVERGLSAAVLRLGISDESFHGFMYFLTRCICEYEFVTNVIRTQVL